MKRMLINITLWAILLSSFIFGVLGCIGLVQTFNPKSTSDLSNKLVYALPKGYIKVVNADGGITVTTIYEPDQEHYYLVNYTPNPLFDDDIDIQVDDQGFLSSIQVTTTSRVPDIIKKIGETAVEAFKIAAAVRAKGLEVDFEKIYDPKDMLNTTMKDPELPIEISLTSATAKNYLYIEKDAPKEPPIDNQCICYRPALPFRLDIKVGDIKIERIVYLPNFSQIVTVDIRRPAFVKKVQDLTFTKGMLSEVHLTKDSEVSAALGIPADLVKTVAGLPLDLINFKTTMVTGETGLLQAQAALIQAQIASRQLKEGQKPTKEEQRQTEQALNELKQGLNRIEERLKKLEKGKSGSSK